MRVSQERWSKLLRCVAQTPVVRPSGRGNSPILSYSTQVEIKPQATELGSLLHRSCAFVFQTMPIISKMIRRFARHHTLSEKPTIHHERVTLIHTSKTVMPGLLLWDETYDNCNLVLRYGSRETTAAEDDYFEAMCSIRLILENDGLYPCCYGASRSAYPSSMSRSMGSGLQVYKLQLGEPAKMIDLVSIFAEGPDVEPVTVSKQRTFYQEWLVSL